MAPKAGFTMSNICTKPPKLQAVSASGDNDLAPRKRRFNRDRWLAKKAAQFEWSKVFYAAHPTLPDDGSPCFVIFSGDPTRTWREVIYAPKSGGRS